MICVAENVNVLVTTTAGQTPYKNGQNERGHFVVDRKMELCLVAILGEPVACFGREDYF